MLKCNFSTQVEECKENSFYEHLRYETQYHHMCEKEPKSVCHMEYHKVCEHKNTYHGDNVEKCQEVPQQGKH